MFQMLTSDFRGQFGPEKFSTKHLEKLIDSEIKAEGRLKRFWGLKQDEYEKRLFKHQR